MRIPNRRLQRNRVLFAILLTFWSLLIVFLLVFLPSTVLATMIVIGIGVMLIGATVRSYLRMPSSIIMDGYDMIIELPLRRIYIPLKDLIDVRYDRSDCRIRIISAGSSHSFSDLVLDKEDEKSIRTSIDRTNVRRPRVDRSNRSFRRF